METCSVTGAKVRLDTKGFCIFCLKRKEKVEVVEVPTVDDEDKNGEDLPEVTTETGDPTAQLRQKFSRVLPKYLGMTFNFLTAAGKESCTEDKRDFLNKTWTKMPEIDISYICHDCAYLVEKICNFFHEMKKLEMELDWKARQLKNIMAFAKRAPMRIKSFRENFTDSGTAEDVKMLNNIETFRKKFMDKCSSRLRKQCPRIILKRKGDPLSKKASLNAVATKVVNTSIFNNVAVQTEPVQFEKSSASKGQSASPVEDNLDNSHSLIIPNQGPGIEDKDDDVPSPTASPAPLSPYSDSVSPEENNEDNDVSRCLIRIRNIESLVSPSKSVSPEKPVRTTRCSLRKLPPVKYTEDDIIEMEEDDQTRSLPSKKQQPKSVPEIIATSSSLLSTNLSGKTIQIHDKRAKKATLTEWLQSTFNCDKCNKMFISEATLSVHKTTCGAGRPLLKNQDADSDLEDQPEQDERDSTEIPMDISTNDEGDSSGNDDDPLGETADQHYDNHEEESRESSSTATATRTTTCTIRILKKGSAEAKQVAGPTRYCKYCAQTISRTHFPRHRQTLKHKQNKRIHKRAKRMAAENVGASSSKSAGEDCILAGESSTDSTPVPSAVVTMSRDENSVKVVKIIYVGGQNGTVKEGDLGLISTSSQGTRVATGESIQGAATVSATSATIDATITDDVIDISDD